MTYLQKKLQCCSREKGITLVVLVITIVIIIILSTIAISMVFGENGLINQASKTKESAESLVSETETEMSGILQEYANIIAENSEITEVLTSWKYDEEGNVTDGTITLKIGDYVDYDCTKSSASYTSTETLNGYGNQTFTASSYKYGWRVLGVDEDTGEILLISEEIVEPTSGGDDYIVYNRTFYYLKGQAGHVNGISELNKISAIYGQGEGATGARSITVEDINKITGYNPNNVGVYDPEQTGSGTKYEEGELYEYGNRVTYYWDGTELPYYSATNGRTGKLDYSHSNGFYWYDSASGWQSSAYTSAASTESRKEITTLESNFYLYYPNTLTESESGTTVGISTESTAYKMLFTNSSTGAYEECSGLTDGVWYWLGSSYVYPFPDCVYFGLRGVAYGRVRGEDLYFSYGDTYGSSFGVRPVVSLESDVSLTDSGETYDGCTLWNIE